MDVKNYSYNKEEQTLTISKEELIRLRNKYHRSAFIYSKKENFIRRDLIQELINLTEPKIF